MSSFSEAIPLHSGEYPPPTKEQLLVFAAAMHAGNVAFADATPGVLIDAAVESAVRFAQARDRHTYNGQLSPGVEMLKGEMNVVWSFLSPIQRNTAQLRKDMVLDPDRFADKE